MDVWPPTCLILTHEALLQLSGLIMLNGWWLEHPVGCLLGDTGLVLLAVGYTKETFARIFRAEGFS